MKARKSLGVLSAVLIAGAVSSAYAGPGDRYDRDDRWSRSAYEHRNDYPRGQRYDDRRFQRGPVVVERTVRVERPVYVERHVVRRPPVRQVIVERPVYVDQAPVYHEPYGYGYPAARGSVSAGTVGGAIVGAIIGSQVGHGHSRAATTAAGAVIGGVLGSHW